MKPVPQVDEKASKASKKAHRKDVLANDEPYVLESSESDPELPAMEEYEVDADGPKGSTRKHPGLIWAIIAIIAVVLLCVAFAAAGDWFTPNQAQRASQTEFEEETVPKDLGSNETPTAADGAR